MTVATGETRLERAFARARAERRLALAVYLTVGYPTLAQTPGLLAAAIEGGADILELGVPFSDPLADGSTVQHASEIALAQGVTLDDCLHAGRDVARANDVPVLLMGYTNPFLQRGFDRLAGDLASAGLAGLIVPDMPAEESRELDRVLAPRALTRIDLYAPTTPDERLARLVPSARGFVYCVALTGVTGARERVGADVPGLVARIRRHTAVPILVGFGISAPDHLRALRGVADGVVVGSAALDAVARGGQDAPEALRAFVSSLRDATAT